MNGRPDTAFGLWAERFAVESREAMGCSEWEAYTLASIYASRELGLNIRRAPTAGEAKKIESGVAGWVMDAHRRAGTLIGIDRTAAS